MRWPDAQSLWLAKELRKLQATLSQDFLAFTRQFDDVWYATGCEVAEEFARQEVGDP